MKKCGGCVFFDDLVIPAVEAKGYGACCVNPPLVLTQPNGKLVNADPQPHKDRRACMLFRSGSNEIAEGDRI